MSTWIFHIIYLEHNIQIGCTHHPNFMYALIHADRDSETETYRQTNNPLQKYK